LINRKVNALTVDQDVAGSTPVSHPYAIWLLRFRRKRVTLTPDGINEQVTAPLTRSLDLTFEYCNQDPDYDCRRQVEPTI